MSRTLGLLAKACLLLSLMWLAYVLLERSGMSSPGPEEEADGGGRSLRERQFSSVEESREQLARPVYVKPPPDSSALGEWGKPTHLTLDPEQKKQEDDSVERYAINIYVSDRISLHRHVLDNRMYE